jgi:UTP-glucose-1-phosphate uridylyltransferase
MAKRNFYGCRIAGKRYDLGSVSGFIAANVEFALRRPELQEVLGRQIVDILKSKKIL